MNTKALLYAGAAGVAARYAIGALLDRQAASWATGGEGGPSANMIALESAGRIVVPLALAYFVYRASE